MIHRELNTKYIILSSLLLLILHSSLPTTLHRLLRSLVWAVSPLARFCFSPAFSFLFLLLLLLPLLLEPLPPGTAVAAFFSCQSSTASSADLRFLVILPLSSRSRDRSRLSLLAIELFRRGGGGGGGRRFLIRESLYLRAISRLPTAFAEAVAPADAPVFL
jgi:hypothetical protein